MGCHFESVCWHFEKERKKEAMMVVREHETGEAGRVSSLIETRWVKVEALFCERKGALE